MSPNTVCEAGGRGADRISLGGKSALKQTAMVEANPPSTGDRTGREQRISMGGQRRRMWWKPSGGERWGRWKTVEEKEPLRRCEVVEKGQNRDLDQHYFGLCTL